jgi:hypothetical protein
MIKRRKNTREQDRQRRIEAERRLNNEYIAERNKPPPPLIPSGGARPAGLPGGQRADRRPFQACPPLASSLRKRSHNELAIGSGVCTASPAASTSAMTSQEQLPRVAEIFATSAISYP